MDDEKDEKKGCAFSPDEPFRQLSRRQALVSGAALLAGGALVAKVQTSREAEAQAVPQAPAAGAARGRLPYVPVVTPNGSTLPYRLERGVKVFHLVAEPVRREFAPGMVIECWGYNGQTPGPTIEAIEGDRVRILVTNKLPERTSVHWHGVILPNGMDGVSGLNQPHIEPGETYAYEFTLRQHGTQLYHPHSDETVQMALGMMGFFVIHPRRPRAPRVDRDFCIFLHEWHVPPGAARPNPAVMTDFNLFTFNSRIYPGTEPLVVRKGQRVRLRFANVSMDSHPIHFHGHSFKVTGTDGGPIPPAAQWPETTVNVAPGTTRDVEFLADNPGDWALHCHKGHHTMNQMSHEFPNMVGVKQGAVEKKIRKLLPGYMAMGSTGMGHMHDMGGPRNWVPMMTGKGPFGDVEMGGMFTVVKIREGITSYQDPGWYTYPEGTRARKLP
jgi:FtsP/CotA-like multicopper oxidase with cupredoxin domain